MATKQITPSRKSLQDFETIIEEYDTQCQQSFAKMAGMDFELFKKAVIKNIGGIHEMQSLIFRLYYEFYMKMNGKDTGIVKIICDSLHDRDELLADALELRNARIDKTSAFLFCKETQNRDLGEEKEKALAELCGMSYESEKAELEKRLEAYKAKQEARIKLYENA